MNVPKPLILASIISLALITATSVTSMPAPVSAQNQFSAVLNGSSVFPPVKTDATGKALLNLVSNGQVMKYNVSGTNFKGANVQNVVITHSTGGVYTDLVVLRSATGQVSHPTTQSKQGLSGPINAGSIAGNFTSKDIRGGGNLPGFKTQDMPSLVKDILSGNVYVKVTTINSPLGFIGGKLISGP